MSLPTIPEGWTVHGDLPEFDAERVDEQQLEQLDEDLLQLANAADDLVLDVGWYPAASRTGRFVCRAVQSSDWNAPLEEFETRDLADVQQWLSYWFEKASAIHGQDARISDEAVASVLVTLEVVSAPEARQNVPERSVTNAAFTASAVRSEPPSRVPEYAA